MTTTVYLVRHGETDLNAANRCQGSLDSRLNANGEVQSEELRERLAGVRFDAAYSSPLARAKRTAEIVLGDSGVEIVTEAAFSELSYGRWQGMTHQEWPDDAAEKWMSSPWEMAFPDGERLADVQARVLPAITRIVEAHQAQTVLIAAHGHVNRVLLLALTGDAPSTFWNIPQDNCESWRLVFEPTVDGGLTLLFSEKIKSSITRARAWSVINAKTKPLGALGALEEYAVQLCLLQQSLSPVVERTRVCVFGADHGVTEEGISAYPSSVTAEMMKNFDARGAAINVIGRANDVEIEVVDVGVDGDLDGLVHVEHRKIRRGTRNFASDAAMTADECERALNAGRVAVQRAADAGVHALGLGEMGIGNTTSAAALLSALCGYPPVDTVGRGTGVSDEVVRRKEEVVERALALHAPHVVDNNPFEWLRRVGGLEIAAIAGAALEARRHPIAIVADGFISTVGILCAAYMASYREGDVSSLGERLFIGHRSSERGHLLAISSVGQLCGAAFVPMLDLHMRLGEGSGAALAMPILRASARVMSEMATFQSAGVSTGDRTEHNA